MRAGAYRLERELGRGGMGTVYLASRDDHEYERKVAVKLLNVGMDQPEHVRRFLNERQILAGLEHAHIAKLLDGGHTEAGQPYLVMEYVDGRPLVEYCTRHELGLKQRIELMVKVCEAVQYAHRHLVVHRDIKPSNVLVNEEGEPKLLDFGIAKVLAEGSERTQQTEQLLTIEYASPEQVKGEAISTATDVYALGVVLYELLEEAKPFGTRDAVALTYAIVYSEPAAMQKAPRELEQVVLKAMEKEAAQRYGSAGELADDLRKYLEGRPVSALGNGRWYVARKFIRRNRLAVGIAAVLLIAVLRLAGQLALANQRLEQERDLALREQRSARQMGGFMVDLFDGANPIYTKGKEISAREMLQAGAKRLSREQFEDREVQANLEMGVGAAFLRLGRWADARPHIEQSLKLLEKAEGYGIDVKIEALTEYGNLLEVEGDLVKAEETGRQLVALARAERPGKVQQALAMYANALSHQMKHGAAEQVYREGMGMVKRGQDEYILLRANLSIALFRQGKYREAKQAVDEVIELMKKDWGGDTPTLAYPYDTSGNLEGARGNFDAARAAIAESVKYTQQMGSDSRSIMSYRNCALAEVELRDRNAKAVAGPLQECAVVRRETMKAGTFDMLALEQLEGWKLLSEGDWTGALAKFRAGVDGYAKMFGAGHLTRAKALKFVGMAETGRGDFDAAERAFVEGIGVFEQWKLKVDPEYADLLVEAGMEAVLDGRWEEAEKRFRKALEMREAMGVSAGMVSEVKVKLAECLGLQGKLDEAGRLLAGAVDVVGRKGQKAEALMAMVRHEVARGRKVEAAKWKGMVGDLGKDVPPGKWREWVLSGGVR